MLREGKHLEGEGERPFAAAQGDTAQGERPFAVAQGDTAQGERPLPGEYRIGG
jgi:hypothetical protein